MNVKHIFVILALVLAVTSSQAFWWLYQNPSSTVQDRPTPLPPNPNNNPWLNFPATFGGNAVVNHGRDIQPDALTNIDRYMKLGEAERMSYAQKAQAESLKRGEKLFASASLGTSGLNCQACHPDGKTAGGKIGMGNHEIPIPSLAGAAKRYPKFKAANDRVITLTEMQNNCIVMFLKGQPLASGSQNAADLTHYISRIPE